MSVPFSSAGRAGAHRLVRHHGGPGRWQVLVDLDAVELSALPDAAGLCPACHVAQTLGQGGGGRVGKDALELGVIGEGQLDLVARLPVLQATGNVHGGADLPCELCDSEGPVAAAVDSL